MLSCDTMVALGNSTKSGNLIFAKNSDRPLTEAQPLVVYPAAEYEDATTLKCTYIEIPQVKHTYRVLGSKPHWMWGFEHGMNEHHVVIGNEAVWSRDGEETENGLLGMDLLRLGLERGKTAYEALHVITDLIEKYGQGGNAAVAMEHRYNNIFIIADFDEAWILETSKRRWVARKVKDVAGISNCYGTEEHWDEDSGDIKEYAYEQGWISRDVPFNFAKAYSVMSLRHRFAHPRHARLNKLLNEAKGNIDLEVIKKIQRDHFEGEIIAPRWSPADGLHVSICMHAMLEKASKTASATHIELTKGTEPIWWNCFSVPCISIFAPYTVNVELPDLISRAGAQYSKDSAWWRFEEFQYAIEDDYPRYMEKWAPIQQRLEQKFWNAKKENPQVTSEEVEENMNEMLEAIDHMMEELENDKSGSTQPQNKVANDMAKKRAGLI